MSGKAETRMRAFLNDTGCYSLTGKSSADWELIACGAGFDLLETELNLLLADLFPDTASPETLLAWEELVRPQAASLTLDQRREMALSRSAVNSGRFTLADLNEMLPGAGFIGALEESGTGLKLAYGINLGLSEEEMKRELDDILPAHLDCAWVAANNWATWDAKGMTWSKLEGLKKNWTQFENYSRAQILKL